MKNDVSTLSMAVSLFCWWTKPCRSLAVPFDWQIAHSESLGAFFCRKMATYEANHFQSLDLLVEEFRDRQENENTKKKTKHDVAMFHWFLVLKGETKQMDELTLQEFRVFASVFQI